MIEIVNKKVYAGEGVYIGRPSVLGNPFKIGTDGSRERVIEKYRAWLRRLYKLGRWQSKNRPTGMGACQPELLYQEIIRLAELSKRQDIVLICWCHPEACHGDVLKDAIEKVAATL